MSIWRIRSSCELALVIHWKILMLFLHLTPLSWGLNSRGFCPSLCCSTDVGLVSKTCFCIANICHHFCIHSWKSLHWRSNIESKQASYVQYISARSKFLKSKPEEKLLCSSKSSSSLSLVYIFFCEKRWLKKKKHLELQEKWYLKHLEQTHIYLDLIIFLYFSYGISDLCEISFSASPFWTTRCSLLGRLSSSPVESQSRR